MPTITTKNDDGSTSYRLIGGRSFTIPKNADVDPHDVPGIIVAVAVDTLSGLADKTHSVDTDLTLSQVGRWRALEAIQRASITRIAQLHGQLVAFEEGLDKRVRVHLAIPVLPPTLVGAALEDAEIRAWWKQAGADDKERVLRNAATDSQCERV